MIKVEDLKRVTLTQDDVLFIIAEKTVDPVSVQWLFERLEELFPDNRFIIVDPEIKLLCVMNTANNEKKPTVINNSVQAEARTFGPDKPFITGRAISTGGAQIGKIE